MKTIKGDLIQLAKNGRFDVIVHGCNCYCRMASGIAKSIRTAFPEAWEADQRTAASDRSKLGDYSSASVSASDGGLTVVNAYTQYEYGTDTRKVDYDAVRAVFKRIKTDFSGRRIGYPKIGAGLAGGDWAVISSIIDEELDSEDHTLVVYQP